MTVGTHDFIHKYIPTDNNRGIILLTLHGTGGDEQSLLGLGRQLALDAALLSPRGKVLEGPNPRFFRRKAEGVFDMEDLIYRTHELADWIEAASAEYGIERQSLVAVGYSNGANIAASIMLLRPEVLRRAVLLRAMLPLHPDKAPKLDGTDVLIAAGEYDPLIPLPEAERLARTFKDFGAQVTFQKQTADHRLIEADIIAAHDWIQRTNAFTPSTPTV